MGSFFDHLCKGLLNLGDGLHDGAALFVSNLLAPDDVQVPAWAGIPEQPVPDGHAIKVMPFYISVGTQTDLFAILRNKILVAAPAFSKRRKPILALSKSTRFSFEI